jgi:hypothetical protein
MQAAGEDDGDLHRASRSRRASTRRDTADVALADVLPTERVGVVLPNRVRSLLDRVRRVDGAAAAHPDRRPSRAP